MLGLIVLNFSCFAQDGMDYSGLGFGHYSKLRTKSWPAIPFFQNLNAEKALGVYQGLFTPQSFLEVNSTPAYMPYPMPGLGLGELFRTTGPSANINAWRMFTGITAGTTTEKGVMFTDPNTPTCGSLFTGGLIPGNDNLSVNQFNIQSTLGDIVFRAAGNTNVTANTPGTVDERMRITSTFWQEPNTTPAIVQNNNYTRVGIYSGSGGPGGGPVGPYPLTGPLSILHLGNATPYQWGGHRNWMYYGTYITRGSDAMYVGMRQNEDPINQNATDKSEAIIAWGDNPSQTSPDTRMDHLRIIFNSAYSAAAAQGSASHANGLEVMRFSPKSIAGNFNNSNTVYTGIGDFSINNSLFPFGDPVRKLEILSDKLSANAAGNPQVRITHTQQDPANLTTTGKYSEFHTDSIGNLLINTFDNVQSNVLLKQRYVGINTNAPGNTVEINSQAASALPGSSGLRFSDLTNASSPQPNPGTGILSVDANGDVIYVNGGTGVGNYCGTASNPLTNDYEVPLNNHQYHFTGIDSTGVVDGVTVGLPACGFNTNAKLTVYKANSPNNVITNNIDQPLLTTYSGSFINSDMNFASPQNKDFSGIYAISVNFGNPNSPTSISANSRKGVNAFARHAKYNYGVYGRAQSVNTIANTNSFGGWFTSSADTNISNSLVVGVFGGINNLITGGSVFNPAQPFFAGYFNGKVITTGTQYYTSDKTLKEEIKEISDPLGKIMKIRASYYKYKDAIAEQNGIGVTSGYHYGFIAQDLEPVLPELVINTKSAPYLDSLGNEIAPQINFKAVDYNGMIGINSAAIQQLNNKVDKAGLSDALVKTNISGFNALEKILSLQPNKFNYTNVNVPQLNFSTQTDYGFVAQVMEQSYPELIDSVLIQPLYDSSGNQIQAAQYLKSINYKAFSAILTRGIQEQQVIIDSLKSANNKQDSINNSVQQQLAQLSSLINSCCSVNSKTNQSPIAQTEVELSDKNIVVLIQNVPNPFAEQTTISYNIPDDFKFAQVIFYNNMGQLIKAIDIKTKGRGQLNVFANDLSNGIYSYTLVIDGKIIDTKKMLKTQ